MAEALFQRGHNIHVITYHLGEKTDLVPFKVHRINNIPTYRKLSSGPTYQKLVLVDAILAIQVRRLLKKLPFDLIHAHHYEGLLVANLASKGYNIPIFYDAHTLLESELPHYKIGLPFGLKKKIGCFLDGWLPKRAHHIISVTDEIKHRLVRNGCQNEKFTVIPNGIEFDHFGKVHDNLNAHCSMAKILAYAGNTSDFQGIDLLLKAFQKALLHRNDLQLWIITKSSFDRYRSLAESLNLLPSIRLVHADFEDLPKYLASADIVLNPRINCDGYPVKLLNYMASGKPIVSFKGSAKNIVHGINGWIVKDADIDAFADAILLLLDSPNLTRTLGINAKEQACKMLTWEAIAQNLEVIYESEVRSYH